MCLRQCLLIVIILNNYDRGRRLTLITLIETLIFILERAYKPVFFLRDAFQYVLIFLEEKKNEKDKI